MQEIIVTGMTCQHCVASVTKALAGLAGAENVNVNLADGKTTWEGSASKENVAEAVRKIGFDVAQ